MFLGSKFTKKNAHKGPTTTPARKFLICRDMGPFFATFPLIFLICPHFRMGKVQYLGFSRRKDMGFLAFFGVFGGYEWVFSFSYVLFRTPIFRVFGVFGTFGHFWHFWHFSALLSKFKDRLLIRICSETAANMTRLLPSFPKQRRL